MDLSWFQSILFGFLSGLSDILPVSAQAHKAILLKLFGFDSEPTMLRFVIHLATLAALYYSCSNQILRINRQLKLAKVPKKRRKRPVDMRTILDFKLLRTMAIPVILGFIAYYKTSSMNHSLNWIALFLLVNGVILYLPVLLPSGNKDSRSLSRLEGVLMGLGSAASVLPGISSVGGMTSVASLCGTDRSYALNLSFLLQMLVSVGLLVFDMITMVSIGVGTVSFGILLCYLSAAVAAFCGVWFGIRVMRIMSANIGFSPFAYYSLGAALFSFIVFLTSV